jgi:transcription elongation factor Elf1
MRPVPPHKRCPQCGHTKSASLFYQRRNGRLSSWCQDCTRRTSRQARRRRHANPAELERSRAVDRARQRRYRWLHQPPTGGEAA